MKLIKLDHYKKVLTIELNRPEVHNAINHQMMDEIEKAFKDAAQNEDIHVILLTGAGEKTFAAGGDLVEFQHITSEEDAYQMLKKMANILSLINESPKLTIVAINGIALGGGAELTTAFDIRLAKESAKLGFVQRNLGLTTGWGGGSRLQQILGVSVALPYFVTGEVTDVTKWYENGYIHQIYPDSSFRSDTIAFASKCATIGLGVLDGYKLMKNRVFDRNKLQLDIENEIRYCAKLWSEKEHLQAVERFLEKKK